MRVLIRELHIGELRQVDSDTVAAWVQIDATTRHLWRIRLRRIEGGEHGTLDGAAGERALLLTLCAKDGQDRWFWGNPKELDRYGRHVGDIEFADGTRLCTALIQRGHHWQTDRNAIPRLKPQTT